MEDLNRKLNLLDINYLNKFTLSNKQSILGHIVACLDHFFIIDSFLEKDLLFSFKILVRNIGQR